MMLSATATFALCKQTAGAAVDVCKYKSHTHTLTLAEMNSIQLAWRPTATPATPATTTGAAIQQYRAHYAVYLVLGRDICAQTRTRVL